jgi:hypothetical protein
MGHTPTALDLLDPGSPLEGVDFVPIVAASSPVARSLRRSFQQLAEALVPAVAAPVCGPCGPELPGNDEGRMIAARSL